MTLIAHMETIILLPFYLNVFPDSAGERLRSQERPRCVSNRLAVAATCSCFGACGRQATSPLQRRSCKQEALTSICRQPSAASAPRPNVSPGRRSHVAQRSSVWKANVTVWRPSWFGVGDEPSCSSCKAMRSEPTKTPADVCSEDFSIPACRFKQLLIPQASPLPSDPPPGSLRGYSCPRSRLLFTKDDLVNFRFMARPIGFRLPRSNRFRLCLNDRPVPWRNADRLLDRSGRRMAYRPRSYGYSIQIADTLSQFRRRRRGRADRLPWIAAA